MVSPNSLQSRVDEHKSTSKGQDLDGGVRLFLRLWSYGGPSQPPSGLALDQDQEIAGMLSAVIRDGQGVMAGQQAELWSVRFESDLQALSTAKALQQHFLTFHRETEPKQVVPSILIYGTEIDQPSVGDAGLPQDMLANVTSAQILVAGSIYERVKNVPGFQFNPRPVREAGETFGPEAIYELLWTDESTYGHLRQASRTILNTVGRYQVQEELGRGAMGAVYKAYDQLIGRTVALKTIPIDRNAPDRDELIQRLKQEAKAAGGLDHPNIITIYDVGQERDVVYLSMQFVKGITLAKLLADVGVPSLPTFLSWADQIASAVGFAHDRGVVHRDLKPANLMVTENGAIKVLDFGIAKIENASLTQTGLVVGTPSYMAPEQVAGKKVDHRADIFALGSVFYELLTREKPFRGDVTTLLYKIVNEDPVAPSLVNPAVPGGIDAIVRKALAKDPRERYQSCGEMRHAIMEQASRLQVEPPARAPAMAVAKPAPRSAAVPNPLLADIAPQSSSRRWPMATAVLLMLVATAAAAFFASSHPGAFFQLTNRVTGALRQTSPASRVSTGPQTQAPAALSQTPEVQPQVPSQSFGDSTTLPQQQSMGQSSGGQRVSDGVPTAAATSSAPGETQALQSTEQALTPVQAASPSDHKNPFSSSLAADTKEPAGRGDSAKATSPDRASRSLAVRATQRPKQPNEDPAMTVDGFSRHDVPELLRQADAAAGRGDYRLARYEYNLILKLDRSNAPARSGLQRVDYAEQSH